jgi:hypothetical protein
MARAHLAVRSRFSVAAPRPLDTAAAWHRTRRLVEGLAAQAARTGALAMSAIRLGHELEGAPPRHRRSLGDGWVDSIRR